MNKEQLITELEERINAIDSGDYPAEAFDEYDEMLNDCHGAVKIGTLSYDPAEVLKAVDPVAYRIGMNEYFDARLEDLREELEDLRRELSEEVTP